MKIKKSRVGGNPEYGISGLPLKEAVIAITYRCNSKCRMCGIWKIQDHESEFSPNELKNLPKNLTDINISGGEPFLRGDIVEVIRVLSRHIPKANLIISSNGFATKLITDQMREVLKVNPSVGVVISLDGIGRQHDLIRGVKGGFSRVMDTFRQLKKIGVQSLKFGYTIGDYNFLELKKVYGLCRQSGVEMSLTLVHSSKNYFGQENKLKKVEKMAQQIDWLIEKELKGFSYRHWARAFYAFGMKQFLLTGKRILPDYSGQLSVFIDPRGNVFPCDISDRKIGVLKHFDDLESVEAGECPNSWMMCTVRQSIKKHKWQAIKWILLNKFRAFFKKL